MRILVFSDNHFCEKSSIITKYGTRYTVRLENQLKSLNWVETLAQQHNCNVVVCLGDFFDHAHLTDQELTALKDIHWTDIPHYFLVGNHESEENDLQYSSTMALLTNNSFVLDKATLIPFYEKTNTIELAFLPYTLESNRHPIAEYFSTCPENLRLLFTHTDILGMQLGPVVSKTGFSIEELESVCHLCVNGHLHNGLQISSKVINLGNLTGKDFSEDAFKYSHRVILIDTEKMTVDYVENPYAFNFYKIEINTEADLNIFEQLKTNAVLSVKCSDQLILKAREKLESSNNIVEARLIVTKDATKDVVSEVGISSLLVDQCEKFAECCRARLDNSPILEMELAEVLK